MPLIDGVKMACEVCIRGHRSSRCTHTDRPLFEIRKKGRPITQCNHCRDLRKVKQVHVRCGCRKEAGWVGKRSGKSKHATDSIADEDYTECSCDETGICPCAVPRNDSASLQTPGSSHILNCHGPTDGWSATAQPSCCSSQAETPTHCECNSPLSPLFDMNSTDHALLSSTSGLSGGVRPRRNSAPPACACPAVQIRPAASNSTHSCCNQPSPTRLPPNVVEPGALLNIPSNSHATSSYADSMFHVNPLLNASQPANPSYGAVRAEPSTLVSRFAPYPNDYHSRSLNTGTVLPQQLSLLHSPTISTLDIAAPQSSDLATPLTTSTTPLTLEDFLAPIPTRSSPGASKGNAQYAATSGTIFAAPIEPIVSNCSCSGSCSCVLCSGSNLEKVLMSASLGTEIDNCQSCNDCFDCKSLLNDLPQLTPLRDASIAAPPALRTAPAPQLGLQSQTDVHHQLVPPLPSTIKSNRHKESSPGWPAAPDPDILSLLRDIPSSEADLTTGSWSDYLLSAPLDDLWAVNGNSDQLARTGGEPPVTQGLNFNGHLNDAHHYVS